MTVPDPRRLLYRSLDPDGARRLAARHLSGCDDGELFLQYAASEAFGFDDGRLSFHRNEQPYESQNDVGKDSFHM